MTNEIVEIAVSKDARSFMFVPKDKKTNKIIKARHVMIRLSRWDSIYSYS